MNITILRLLNNNFVQLLSSRSSLILNLILGNKVAVQTEIKSKIKSTDSIFTFHNFNDAVIFYINPGFRIPETIEFPRLYIIFTKMTNNDYVEYYQFGPSSRVRRVNNEEVPNNNSYYIETWTNSFGFNHREDGYAVNNFYKGRLESSESYLNGILTDVNNLPAIVEKGNVLEIRKKWEKRKKSKKQILPGDIFNELYARKSHYTNGKYYRKDRDTREKRVKGIYVFENILSFEFNDDPSNEGIEFDISDNVMVEMRIGTQEVLDLIEDFGNYDSDGNDYSDRFIRDYFDNL